MLYTIGVPIIYIYVCVCRERERRVCYYMYIALITKNNTALAKIIHTYNICYIAAQCI